MHGGGVSAKGLSSQAYDGHYFWDSEIYILPFLAYTQPRLARNLLRFRYSMLDRARRRVAVKRGGAMSRVNLDEIPDLSSRRAGELIALDDALKSLANIDPRKAKVIELRFFGGLAVEETAEVLNVSPDTVMRDWRLARAWLLTELSGRK